MFASLVNLVLGRHLSSCAVSVLVAAFFQEPPFGASLRNTTPLGCVLALAGNLLRVLPAPSRA